MGKEIVMKTKAADKAEAEADAAAKAEEDAAKAEEAEKMRDVPEKEQKKKTEAKAAAAKFSPIEQDLVNEKKTEANAAAKKIQTDASSHKVAPADLAAPGGSEGENWTTNMPKHLLEGYAQKGRKEVSEQELVDNKDKEEDKEEEEEESEEEDSEEEEEE